MQRGWLLGVGDEPDFSELRALALDAGVKVVGETWQRGNPHPNTYLGSGRLSETIDEARSSADMLLANDPLTPRQERLIEERFDKSVIDWTGLILDVFARRAWTAEGKLQVELAQCQYLLGRSRGLWTHLDRLPGGGVGTRGPGETQLESDRRMLRQRMNQLERRVRAIGDHRERLARDAGPTIAIAGYTNAGKTSLLGALADLEIAGADMLFATLDPQRRRWRCGGMECVLADTVGLIDRLPTELVRAFDATLSVAVDADLIIHVIDASAEDPIGRASTTELTLQRIGATAPRLEVLAKTDAVEASAIPAELDGFLRIDPRDGTGSEALVDRVIETLCGPSRRMHVATRDIDRMRLWGSVDAIDRRGATSVVEYRPISSSTFEWELHPTTLD